MSKILVVEDDLSIQALLHDFIEEAGHSVVLAADGVEALAIVSTLLTVMLSIPCLLPKTRKRKAKSWRRFKKQSRF